MSDDVVVLAWPEQAAEAERLRGMGVPRLLLVSADGDPPRGIDHLADWVRVPATEQEVAARVVALMRRAADPSLAEGEKPTVDQHGRIVYRECWSALSPTETRLAKLLSDRFLEVVTEAELRECAWPSDTTIDIPKPNALRVHLHRMRQRVGVLGLEVVSVRGEGVVLQPSADPGARMSPLKRAAGG